MMPFDPYLVLIVLGIVVIIVFFGSRLRTGTDAADAPTSGAELIEGLQRALGIAIVVESVEADGSAEAVTIRATLMSGHHTRQVAVGGPTESDAWAALARAAIAWRNSDFQHVPIWPAGG